MDRWMGGRSAGTDTMQNTHNAEVDDFLTEIVGGEKTTAAQECIQRIKCVVLC